MSTADAWISAWIAIFGAAWILGHAQISLRVRLLLGGTREAPRGGIGTWLVDLVECPACCSFWLALCAGWFVLDLRRWPFIAFVLCSVAVSFVLGVWTGLIEREVKG